MKSDADPAKTAPDSNGQTQIAEALIAKGADLEAQNANGDTALFWAARNGHTEIAQTLIAKGADLGLCDRNGNTAVTVAVYNGHAEIVRLLENLATATPQRSPRGVGQRPSAGHRPS